MKLNELLEKYCKSFSENCNKATNDISTNDIVGISLFAKEIFQKSQQNLIILTPTIFEAEQIRNELYSLVNENDVIYIPSEELLMVEYVASSNDILSDKLFGLYNCLHSEHKILVTNASSVFKYLPAPKLFNENTINLSINDEVNIQKLKETFLSNGYEIVNKVSKTGEVAFRGDILDIYSINNEFPIRIDFFDDVVEKIHKFNVSTQESFEEITNAVIIPNTDQLYTDKDLIESEEKIREQLKIDLSVAHNPELSQNTEIDIASINSYSKSARLYKYFSFISSDVATIFDYFPCKTLIFSNYQGFNDEANQLDLDSTNFLYELNASGKNITKLSIFNSRALNNFSGKTIKNNLIGSGSPISVRQPTFLSTNIESIKTSILNYLNSGYVIYFSFAHELQKNSFIEKCLKQIFEEKDLNELIGYRLFLNTDNISLGFDLFDDKVVVLTQKELYGFRFGSSKYITKFKQSTILKSYDELEVGDFVVHENYGIGKFDGIKQITTQDITNDFLKIKYQGDSVLYVPLEQFRLVRKYISKEGFEPKLSKLFSDSWTKTKQKIKDRVNLLADKLMELYSKQLSIKGFSFSKDDDFQTKFESNFDYQLTPDQEEATKEVKADMERPYPMDRLICGDVGFGKTEIAFRAAFKAINSGKQVLFLCPTTLLAKQHYERALLRFTEFGINIVCMTRYLTSSETRQACSDVALGKVHMVIGTHKALSKKLVFKDLGLLIIDEEQRFGVEQKEKIKMKFPHIDTLTLSATPIPRTLQISLIGMKSVSLINTAPKNRAPIQTNLIEYNFTMLINVIKKELGRGGQVYFLHNQISTIDETRNKLSQALPNVTIEFIHGQMDKDIVDGIMDNFYNGNIQILVCTSIIENGIDVPNANLMIVEDADKFGLAQLYQIKGRVGRSDKLAYAYLTYKKSKKINEQAQKRLKAIKDFTELGSGYKIAQRDLMIRGAGDILGPEQAGFINDVGVDLYLKLLNEAISSRKGKFIEESDKFDYKKVNVNGYIPNEYANDENKFEIYQLINDCKTTEELESAKTKINDIYGKIPAETQYLLKIRYLKIKLNSDAIEDFEENNKTIVVVLSNKFCEIKGIGSDLFIKLYKYKDKIFFTNSLNKIKITLKKENNWLEEAISLIEIVTKLYNNKHEIG